MITSSLAPELSKNITNSVLADISKNSVEEKKPTTINTVVEDNDSMGELREDRCNTPDSVLGQYSLAIVVV